MGCAEGVRNATKDIIDCFIDGSFVRAGWPRGRDCRKNGGEGKGDHWGWRDSYWVSTVNKS